MDDVGLTLWRYRIHALDLLETKIISDQPPLLGRIHRAGGLLYLRHRLLLPKQDRTRSTHHHRCHLRRFDRVRLPKQVRLYLMDAVSLWWPLGAHHFRLHVGLLPLQQQSGVGVWRSGCSDLQRLHLGRHTARHETLPR